MIRDSSWLISCGGEEEEGVSSKASRENQTTSRESFRRAALMLFACSHTTTATTGTTEGVSVCRAKRRKQEVVGRAGILTAWKANVSVLIFGVFCLQDQIYKVRV